MFASKPLFQRDFFEGPPLFRRPGMESGRNAAEPAKGTVASADVIQATLAKAYERIQSAVQSRFPAVKESTNAADAGATENDYSPQAVADRILSFVSDRLAQEKANGASEERLQDLYKQALKGVEKGLKEGRNIIQDQGLFSGDTKDTYYQTVNRIADGLQALGEQLFGADLDVPDEGSTPVQGGFEASRTQVQMERSRSFEMEVMTQEGDRVKIQVSSGQAFSSDQVKFNGGGTSIDGFEMSFSSFDNMSFSVEGDLNEGELAALNDLFSQVNDVAETFYGGDVEQAFNQAMDVGMDPDQLASFAVNINQAESIAVRDTYVAVQNMTGPSRENPYQDMFERLGAFAQQAQENANKLLEQDQGIADIRSLYAELLGRLHSDNAADNANKGRDRGHGDAFQRFANRLAG